MIQFSPEGGKGEGRKTEKRETHFERKERGREKNEKSEGGMKI